MIKRKQRWGVGNEVDNENKNKELTDEELQELVLQAQQEALQEEKIKEQKPRRPFPKWIYWIIAISMVLNAHPPSYLKNFPCQPSNFSSHLRNYQNKQTFKRTKKQSSSSQQTIHAGQAFPSLLMARSSRTITSLKIVVTE